MQKSFVYKYYEDIKNRTINYRNKYYLYIYIFLINIFIFVYVNIYFYLNLIK